MNTFKKIVLFGLLSAAIGANCATPAPTDAPIITAVEEGKFYMVEAAELDNTQMGTINRKHSGRFSSRNNVFFIYITGEDLGGIENIETILTGAANKVIYAISPNKANVATLYACWLVKNGANSIKAINAAQNAFSTAFKADFTLPRAQEALVTRYYLEKNMHLLKLLERTQPGLSISRRDLIALFSGLAIGVTTGTAAYIGWQKLL